MSRVTLSILGLLLLLLLLIAGGLAWLVGSTPGARFALVRLGGLAGAEISVQAVQGRLWDRLHLTGVQVVVPRQRATLKTVELDWEPRELLSGRLLVRRLELSEVKVQDNVPVSKEAPRFAWPKLPPLARRLSAEIQQLRITGFSYRRLSQDPVLVNALSSSLSWDGTRFTLAGLRLASPGGQVTGELVAGLVHPSLRLDLILVPVQPTAQMDLFSLQARLLPGKAPEQVAGLLALSGRSGGKQRLELTGELAMTHSAVELRQASLTQRGRRGRVTGRAGISFPSAEPVYSLELQASDLDLAPELKRPTRISGTLSFSGTMARYRGSLKLSNKGGGWEAASLATDFQGSISALKLAPLRGSLLDGSLSGVLDIDWRHGTRLKGSLSGRGLNPQRLTPDWKGVVNLDLAGDVELPEKGAPRGMLKGELLESRLHGQVLAGVADVAFVGENLRVRRLHLRGRGFHLTGAGELEERLSLAARVSDLSRLVPGAAGTLEASGWVRWRERRLSGSLAGTGRNLGVDGVSIAATRFRAQLNEGAGYPLLVDASLEKLRSETLKADDATLRAEGTRANHQIVAAVAANGAQARLQLSGGYQDGIWRGRIEEFSGQDGVGPFHLMRPAPLTVSGQDVTLAPLVIVGAPSEQVEIAGKLSWEPQAGSLRAHWSGVNLARANPWVTGATLSGASAGAVSARLMSGGRIDITASADARGALEKDGRRIEINGLSILVNGSGEGVRTEVSVQLMGGEARALFTSGAPSRLALPRKGEFSAQWSGFDLNLLAPLLPPGAAMEGRLSGGGRGTLAAGGRVDLRGGSSLAGGRIRYSGNGDALDARMEVAELTFGWRGSLSRVSAGKLVASARVEASGLFTSQGRSIALEKSTLTLDAGDAGLHGRVDLALPGSGVLRGSLHSPAAAGLTLPETAELALEWQGINPALFKGWMPGNLNLAGDLAGHAAGRLLPGQHLDMAGELLFSRAKAQLQQEGGEMTANLRQVALSWRWRGPSLTGELALELDGSGTGRGSFELPIPALLPVAPLPEGRVRASFSGQLQEKGVLSAVMPGVVQESHGKIDADIRVSGEWREPRLEGRLQIAKAGGYLPAAGITLKEVQLDAVLARDSIRIDSFSARSGPGQIRGEALIRLNGWQVIGYRGSLKGERFQTVYLPELQLLSSPQLNFQGNLEQLSVRGEVVLPEMLVSGPPVRAAVAPSKDVILEGAPVPTEKGSALALDVQVRVTLGDKVLVKASGIDAKLGGGIDVVMKSLDKITSSGEIRVVKGNYRAYGMDLEIVRGRFYYAGGPIDHPTLDILALRTAGEVRAGVIVEGFLTAPVIKLYSEPPLPDVDILAYMVLGHPLGNSAEQSSMVSQAAGALLSLGPAEGLQEQIKDRLGLSVLGIESGSQGTSGLMGYKEIPVSPTGAGQAKGVTTESMLTVGKYLTPKIYFSYGRSLLTGASIFQLRYDISRRWQVETQTGSESGADVYYKIEFN